MPAARQKSPGVWLSKEEKSPDELCQSKNKDLHSPRKIPSTAELKKKEIPAPHGASNPLKGTQWAGAVSKFGA